MGQPPDLKGGNPPYKTSMSSTMGPKYLIMTRANFIPSDENLSKVSPFLIKKVIDATCTGEVDMCKKLRNGTVLIKTKNFSQAQKLIQLKALSDSIKVTVTEHKSLNFVKGVMYSNDLRGISEEDILNELKSQQVTQVHKILKRENESLIETGLIVLTFEAITLPAHIFVGYEKVNLRPYVPLPMKCNNCFTYGHIAKYCKNDKVCANCGEENHIIPDLDEVCERQKNCINCEAANGFDCRHSATDKTCPVFLKEKEIQAIITLEKVNRSIAVSKYNVRHLQNNISFATTVSTNVKKQTPLSTVPATTSRKIVDYSDTTLLNLPILTTMNKTSKSKTTILPRKTTTRTRNNIKKALTNQRKESDGDLFASEGSDDMMDLAMN